MKELIRRPVSELISISKREPTLKTVFVEGEEDTRLYSRLIREIADNPPTVLPISKVEIELSTEGRSGAGSGNRARVIELACILHENNVDPSSLLCVVDTDLGFYLPKGPEVPGLVYTDVTALETYYWCNSTIRHLLEDYLGKSDLAPQGVVDAILPALKRMFSIRLSIAELGLPLGWLDDKYACLEFKNSVVVFDWEEFTTRILNKTGNAARKTEVIAAAIRFHDGFSGNETSFIHGHDFINLLRFVLVKNKVDPKLIDHPVFFRVITLFKKMADLEHFPMFSRIKEFCVTSSSGGVATC